eukprot:349201-Alexandrium_andersonii.AAC.1
MCIRDSHQTGHCRMVPAKSLCQVSLRRINHGAWPAANADPPLSERSSPALSPEPSDAPGRRPP